MFQPRSSIRLRTPLFEPVSAREKGRSAVWLVFYVVFVWGMSKWGYPIVTLIIGPKPLFVAIFLFFLKVSFVADGARLAVRSIYGLLIDSTQLRAALNDNRDEIIEVSSNTMEGVNGQEAEE